MDIERYDEGRLVWTAKGWTVDGVALEIADQIKRGGKPELAALKLSFASLRRKSMTGEPIDPPVAEVIEGLEIRPDRQHPTEIVMAGLKVVHGQPAAVKSPEEVARGLLEHFPTDEFAVKMADAVSKQAGLAAIGPLLDTVTEQLCQMPKPKRKKLARRVALAAGAGAMAGCMLMGMLPRTGLEGLVYAAVMEPPK